ncbi:hypothetical protein THAOC_26533, partial [Thalassiosira oceanica]
LELRQQNAFTGKLTGSGSSADCDKHRSKLNSFHLPVPQEAEYYFCIDNHENAAASYRQAIISAQEHRFCHEEGLAEEKFATYLMYCNQSDAAL